MGYRTYDVKIHEWTCDECGIVAKVSDFSASIVPSGWGWGPQLSKKGSWWQRLTQGPFSLCPKCCDLYGEIAHDATVEERLKWALRKKAP